MNAILEEPVTGIRSDQQDLDSGHGWLMEDCPFPSSGRPSISGDQRGSASSDALGQSRGGLNHGLSREGGGAGGRASTMTIGCDAAAGLVSMANVSIVGSLGAIGPAAGAFVGGTADDATGGVLLGLIGTEPIGAISAGEEEAYWRGEFSSRPYVRPGTPFNVYAAAYQLGWESREKHSEKTFDEIEFETAIKWGKSPGSAQLSWNRAKFAIRDAWDRVDALLNIAPSDTDAEHSPPPFGESDSYYIHSSRYQVGRGGSQDMKSFEAKRKRIAG